MCGSLECRGIKPHKYLVFEKKGKGREREREELESKKENTY